MPSPRRNRFAVRLAVSPADLSAAQRLRWLAFLSRRSPGLDPDAVDADEWDAVCRHVLVEETATGTLVACFRFLVLESGAQIGRSYAARHYDLTALAAHPGPLIEMGRFCVHPEWRDPDILRVAWAAMAAQVRAAGARMLFGCSSFTGADPAAHVAALAILRARHLAPRRWWPRVKAPRVFRFARALARRAPDPAGMAGMPPLLRTYLRMGGWVSDHAVVDEALDTLHVFTGVEIAAIPAGRALRMAGG